MKDLLNYPQTQLIHVRNNQCLTVESTIKTLSSMIEDGTDYVDMIKEAELLLKAIKTAAKLYDVICDLDDIMEGRL